MNKNAQIGDILLAYMEKLRRLALVNMTQQLQRKIPPEEMAGSIIGSVIRAHENGKLALEIEESEEFWKLLVAIALNKIRKKVRYFNAAKRNKEVLTTEDMPSLENLAMDMGEPTEEYGECIAEVLNRVETELDADEKLILAGRLAGNSNEQIAEQLNAGKGMSTKTVSRKWKRIVQTIQNSAGVDEA